jgi:murein DD-endopeptidase MepM/ murein hydrolase activator NlpD
MLFFTLYWLFSGASPQPFSEDSSNVHKDTHLAAVSPPALYGVPIDSMKVVRAMIQANESLGEILSRFNISASQIHQLGSLPRELFDARRLRANKPYTVIHANDSLHTARSFIYHPNPIQYVALHFADSLEVVRGEHPVDTITHSLSGTIQTSLYQAIVDADGSPALANALADVYAWEIDFFGLQGGDCFKVMYTSYEVEGQSAGFGRIQAANFTHMNKELLAFAYDQGEGLEYFDEVGNSLRKTFLKAPLQYSRISSHFSYSRLHPILKIRRPHLGVDYAAPRGTPVLSVGDGVIESVSYNRGAGKMVKIRHNSNFTTAYLHLSKYGSGIKSGVSVSQGQVIGYVGSTGLSTGPHLDFRFYKNGQPIDPLKVDPPSANPITEEHREPYARQMVRLMDQLHSLSDREIQWAMMSEDRNKK